MNPGPVPAEPTFADLPPLDLDQALAFLQHARAHIAVQAAEQAAWTDSELAATLSTLHDCARWVGQFRRLNLCVHSYLGELAARAGSPFATKFLPSSPPGLTWLCANCDDVTALNRDGYCARCGSDSLQVVAHVTHIRAEVRR